ncbi:MAG: D-tyrosyl-tRNA(Tyr) deacylase [Spirochaetales bacterium]|nr:D-tyrosyl-tRNA(Tyr) deacylase [Spirochaetales bacterium]
MRAVVQRVKEASVTIGGKVSGSIDKGLLILLGIEDADTDDDIAWLAGKIARLRIFPDGNGIMNRSVTEAGGDILAVSQFTLHASIKKGNRPYYGRSALPEKAVPLYHAFIKKLEDETGKTIRTGEFGAMMDVGLINDGPVTIIMDSKRIE